MQGVQFLFRDNRTINIRDLTIKHTCLVEEKDNKVVRGWRHYYRNQYTFRGHEGLPAGKATLSFERDIVLNLHKVLKKEDLPEKGGDIKQHRDIAKSRFRQIAAGVRTNPAQEKLNVIMGIGFVILTLAYGLSFVV